MKPPPCRILIGDSRERLAEIEPESVQTVDPLVASHNIARDIPERRPRVDVRGEPVGANARSVWTIASTPYNGAHHAAFPRELPRRCILAGSAPGDLVLDPFAGTGTTLEQALILGRRALGIELSPAYGHLINERLRGVQLPLPTSIDAA